ncbi:MAG TPA: D-alanyl-D-alanine carboxypeptidase/D-alanyl-D-alanine-endopeptidase [Longimicrobiales bacterium]|nr:D-alanyl-D-alanine carboxypeptidase/D-alanyl-D-alanine-endopeptidase [Longimicrobiales bacterium]
MMTRRLAGALLCALLLPHPLHAQRADSLPAGIRAILQRPGAVQRAHWGIDVVDARTGASLARHNADRLFIPASNVKLVVAATAAHHLDPEFRYATTLHATGAIENGALRGDLIVFGRGDPTISGRYASGNMLAVWEALGDSLAARGIRRIDGSVVADESYWDNEYVRGDWENYDLLWWYAAPVAPLGFNDNAIDFSAGAGAVGRPADITFKPESKYFTFVNRSITVAAGQPYTLDFTRVAGTDTIIAYGRIPADATRRTEYFAVADPARYAATVFAETLGRRGIAVSNPTVRVLRDSAASAAALRGARVLVTHRSGPLAQVIGPVLQSSQNWFAEQLLKTLGREAGGEGSWSRGLELERRFLIDVVRIDSTSFRLRDASGLSAGNLFSPRAFTALLLYMTRSPRHELVVNALPVAGAATGSLRTRVPELSGRVSAKTGSIGNVDALSGYVTADSGRRVAFSIMANNTGTTATAMRAVLDDIVRAIAREY